MSSHVQFLTEYRYVLLFGAVLAEQMGLPFPAAPLLLTAGALTTMGRLDLGASLLLSTLACLIADLVWFEAGRRRGSSILGWLCRLSIEPDSCVRRTEDIFERHGARTLLFAKFIPGLSTVAPPLAGITGMSLARFAAWDAVGSMLWAGSYLLLGVVFDKQLEAVARGIQTLGGNLVTVVVIVVGGWIAIKWLQRYLFLVRLRVSRITPDELRARLDGNEPPFVVDLRHKREYEHDPVTVPGAVRMTTDELETRHAEIPRDRDVVLYCT
jgi:membrane protein DedA with SNARE-associated domain